MTSIQNIRDSACHRHISNHEINLTLLNSARVHVCMSTTEIMWSEGLGVEAQLLCCSASSARWHSLSLINIEPDFGLIQMSCNLFILATLRPEVTFHRRFTMNSRFIEWWEGLREKSPKSPPRTYEDGRHRLNLMVYAEEARAHCTIKKRVSTFVWTTWARCCCQSNYQLRWVSAVSTLIIWGWVLLLFLYERYENQKFIRAESYENVKKRRDFHPDTKFTSSHTAMPN